MLSAEKRIQQTSTSDAGSQAGDYHPEYRQTEYRIICYYNPIYAMTVFSRKHTECRRRNTVT